MLVSKKNVVAYTIQLDTEYVSKNVTHSMDLIALFKLEFERAGMNAAAQCMDDGGFSYRETERNNCFTEYEVSIVTKTKNL